MKDYILISLLMFNAVVMIMVLLRPHMSPHRHTKQWLKQLDINKALTELAEDHIETHRRLLEKIKITNERITDTNKRIDLIRK